MFPDNDRIMKPMTSDRRFEYRHDCLCNTASSIKVEAVMLKGSLVELIYEYHGLKGIAREERGRSGRTKNLKREQQRTGRPSIPDELSSAN